MNKQKENQLLITATSVDGVSHGIPYPMPILNPVWICVEAIINAHKSGKVSILIHNTTEPTPVTDELLSKFLDYGYIMNESTKPVDKPVVPEVVLPPVEEEKKEEVTEIPKENKDDVVVEEEKKEDIVETPAVTEDKKTFVKKGK